MADRTYRIQQSKCSVEFLGQLFEPFDLTTSDIRAVFRKMRELAQHHHRPGKPVFVVAVEQAPDLNPKLAAENALVISSFENLPGDEKRFPASSWKSAS